MSDPLQTLDGLIAKARIELRPNDQSLFLPVMHRLRDEMVEYMTTHRSITHISASPMRKGWPK